MKLDDIHRLARMYQRTDERMSEQQIKAYMQEQGIDYSNVYQELEMSSRFVDTHEDVSYAKDLVQLHSHTFYEIIYCCSSSGIQYLVGTERYRLQRGDIVFVPPGIGHRPMLAKELAEPYRREVLWVSAECMELLADYFPDMRKRQDKQQRFIRTGGTRWEGLADYFHAGVKEAKLRKPGWQMALCGSAMQLLVQLDRIPHQRGNSSRLAEKPELLDEVMAYIEQNLSGRITLADTAKRFFVSGSTISQLFRQRMGVSFYRCVTQRRLIAAKSMILEGRSLEEVSGRVGFADYSTFYRAFKQEYGISPRQYRKLQAGD